MHYISKLCRHLPIMIVATFACYGVYNTIINNAYQYGATFFDSGEFATVIWRSGIDLYMGPTFGGSIYPTHASIINYIPDFFSYFYPGDRIDYYGLVYGLLFGAMMVSVYVLLLPLYAGRWQKWVAAAGALALFCAQSVFDGIWELRSDYAAPLCLIMAFRFWQLRRYKASMAWFILNAMVREDIGIMTVLPVALLAAAQYYELRKTEPSLAREKCWRAVDICLITLIWIFFTIYIQKNFFPVYDLLQDQYYDRAHPFAHLSYALLENRFFHLLHYSQGIWLPLLVMSMAALLFRDLQLFIGAIAFMPYAVGMFFSKSDMSAMMISYKPFLLVFPLVWPAIIACGKPQGMRRRYAVIQTVILLCSLVYIRPATIDYAVHRWFPQPLTYHARLYRDFGEKQLPQEQPMTAAIAVTEGILALYPYQFPEYWKCWVVDINPDNYNTINTLIWFLGDRNQAFVNTVLKTGHFTITQIKGTKIRVAHRYIPF